MPSTILLVDDDHDSRELLGGLLRDQGHDVHLAQDGRLGLSMLAELPRPCTVLLDLNMPEMGGENVLRALVAMGKAADVAVIVISGDDGVIDSSYPNVVARLSKPFDLGVLNRALTDAGSVASAGG